MTEQLSLWSLIVNASLLVQFVMLLLFFASVVSWVVIIQRGLYLRNAAHNLRQFEAVSYTHLTLPTTPYV